MGDDVPCNFSSCRQRFAKFIGAISPAVCETDPLFAHEFVCGLYRYLLIGFTVDELLILGADWKIREDNRPDLHSDPHCVVGMWERDHSVNALAEPALQCHDEWRLRLPGFHNALLDHEQQGFQIADG